MVYRVRAAVVRVVCLLVSPLMVRAAEDYEARIKRLEQEVEALRAERRTNDVRVFRKEGLRLETSDKAFTGKLGGRIMWNYVHSDKQGVGKANILVMRLQVDF